MNKISYNNLYEGLITTLKDDTKLLLHCCCAPCSTACIERLAMHFDITLYYYNPCIMPKLEYNKRSNELVKLVDFVNSNQSLIPSKYPIKLIIEDYDNESYLKLVKDNQNDPEGGARCWICFTQRLKQTFHLAKDLGFPYFCSTLTVSPHKNSELINSIGLSLQDGATKWLPSDFKKNNGYLKSIALSRKLNLYRQDYCGCSFSHPKV